MFRITFVLVAAVLLATACGRTPSDTDLVSQDKQILAGFEAAQKRFNANEISKAQFVSDLKKLRQKEERVFDTARHHHFTDPTAGNYFYRMRLKFSSPIAETLKDIQ